MDLVADKRSRQSGGRSAISTRSCSSAIVRARRRRPLHGVLGDPPVLSAVGLDPATYVKRQVTFVALGLVIVMLVASFDYRFLKIYAGMIYVASIVLLAARCGRRSARR